MITKIFSKHPIRCLILLGLLVTCTISFAKTDNIENGVENTYQNWCDAVGLSKGNPDNMVKFYAPDAVLVPTLSPKILINRKHGLDDYFTAFTSKKNIQCKTNKIMIQSFGDIAISNGLYTFTYINKNGNQETLPARFTFVYKKYGDSWLVVSHHSSLVPSP